MSFKPLLSIITSIYNGGEDILRFLQAISNQTYENIELIILDDCSTDQRTLEIIDQLKNNQISISKPYKFIQNTQNLGTVYAFQEGLKYASGEYFTFPQTDDYMDNDFYEVLMTELLKNKYDVIKGLLLCEPDKESDVVLNSTDNTIFSILENIKLPLEIKNSNGQILSLFMPDITYCWFHIFNKKILLDNSEILNFLNAVKYGISETLFNNYRKGILPLEKASFYYHKGHKPFSTGGIYNKNQNDYKNALQIESFILKEMLNNYDKVLNDK